MRRRVTIVNTVVSTSTLGAIEGGKRHQTGHQVGVDSLKAISWRVVGLRDGCRHVLQMLNSRAQRRFRAYHTDVIPHQFPYVVVKPRPHLHRTWPIALDLLQLCWRRMYTVAHSPCTSAPEHQAIQQRIGSQPISAMHADTRAFADCKQPRYARTPIAIGSYSAHEVVGGR